MDLAVLGHSHLPHLYLVTVSQRHPTPTPCSHLPVYLLLNLLQVFCHLLHLLNTNSLHLHQHPLSLLQVSTFR